MRRTSILMFGLMLAAATLAGCGDGGHHGDHPAAAETSSVAEAEAHYTIRGQITAVDEDPGSSRLFIHHEAIPDFEVNGQVVGMDSMTMGFAVAPEVSPAGFAVGDKIECEWVIGPDSPTGSIVRIERLDPGTEFDFGAGGMPDASDGGDAHEGHEH